MMNRGMLPPERMTMRQFTKAITTTAKQHAVDAFMRRWYDANGCGTKGLGGPASLRERNG